MSASGSTEEILSAQPGRVVARVDGMDGRPVLVRRIEEGAGSDVVGRLAALRLVEGRRITALAPVQRARLQGSTLEVTEAWVDGFSLASAAAQARVTVNVALALIHDLAQGLAALHRTPESDGRPAHLIHGRVNLEQAMLDVRGQVQLIGLEGLRGAPSVDAQALMEALRQLLDRRTSTPEGRALLGRLRAMSFSSTEAIQAAIATYLRRQPPDRLRMRRLEFNAEVRHSLGLSPAQLAEDPSGGFDLPLATPQTPVVEPGADHAWDPRAYGPASGHESLPDLFASEAIDHDARTTTETYPLPSDDLTVSAGAAEPDPFDAPAAPSPESATQRGALAGGSKPKLLVVDPPPPSASASDIGDYRVVASIGRGGMGEIYLARKRTGPKAGPLVALKILASAAQDADFEDALAMLMDEAAIMARIENPHVLKVTDFGQALGRYFLATEYLEGRPLVRVMIEAYAQERGLDYGVIATIGADAAMGLYAAHTASTADGAPLRVIHRDVSPQNIFVTYDGVTKVIDFGVARASERVCRTAVGLVKGKAAYMSPEQAEGRALDGRSDVFALGVCLWEMTAGRRLFKRDNEYETLLAVQKAEAPPPSQVRGRPNPVLDHIILSALHKDRNQRTPSAHALATQLMELADHVGGPDRRRRVRELLHRLFGGVAAKERALIRRLEANAATGAEAGELLALSGVSAHGNFREITLVGKPAVLNDLENFGVTARPRATSGGAPTTREYVIQAVAKARADAGFSARPATRIAADGDRPRPMSSGWLPISASAGAIEGPQTGAYERLGPGSAGPAAPGSSPVPRVSPPWPALVLGGLLVLAMGAWLGLKLQPADPRAAPRPGGAARAVAPDEDGALTASAASGRPRDGRAPSNAVPAASAAPGRGRGSSLVSAPAELAPVRIVASEEPDPVVRPAVQAPALGRTKLSAFVKAVRGTGMTVSPSRGTFVIDDGRGGTVAVDPQARVRRVVAPGTRGWVVEAGSPTLAAVSWVGRIKGSPWFARSLSVNDCRAELRVDSAGVGIRYGRDEIRLPHGGGLLLDVSILRPQLADRLEVEPLGLSFGREDPSQPQLHCTTGWWGKRVVLRRLPPGRYALRWVGDGLRQTASMEVSASSATGAELIRSVQIP